MQHVSSNLTIILKIFFPIFWTTFFSAFAIAVILSDSPYFVGYPASYLKIGAVLFVVIGVVFMFFTTMRLKRVEMSPEQVFITNYFKHIQIPYDQISRIREHNFGLFRGVELFFQEPNYFGKKIWFLASRRRLQQFLEEHPHISDYLLSLGPEYED